MNDGKHQSRTHRRAAAGVGGTLMLLSSAAFAHHPMDGMTPETFTQGLLSGLGHPIIGLDHFAFIVLAMFLAATVRGWSRPLVPLAFVAATVAGTVVHLGAANIPMVETLVALSVIVAGVLALVRQQWGALALAGVFAISGIFHGYAYGETVVGAEATPILAYLAGFALIQYALILGGVWTLDRLASRSATLRLLAARIGAVAAVATGTVFLALSFA
jgi:urease accessory protein